MIKWRLVVNPGYWVIKQKSKEKEWQVNWFLTRLANKDCIGKQGVLKILCSIAQNHIEVIVDIYWKEQSIKNMGILDFLSLLGHDLMLQALVEDKDS